MTETRSYPRHVKTDAGDIEFRLMGRIRRSRGAELRATAADP